MYFLDLLGTLAFAITGAYKAKGAKLNIFGVIFLGTITAIGGGTIRDLIIGKVPLFYLKDYNYLLIAVLAGVLIYFIPIFFQKRYSFFRFIDSLGLSAFIIIGVLVSYNYLLLDAEKQPLLSLLVTVFLGMLTGFGGGIIRDAVMGDTPYALKSGSNYAFSAFSGAFVFYIFFIFLKFSFPFSSFVSMLTTLYLREIVSPFGIYKKIIK